MAKKADPKKIGAFVVGAIVLVMVGLVVFGSGKFFAKTRTFVLFFEGSVGGLNVGAPVNFRGVRVGSVKDIVVRYNPEDDSLLIPVYVEFEPGRIEGVNPEHPKQAKELIERGLRAQLGMQSFVTGQLSVEFDFHPGSPAKLVGAESRYPELPTLPSSLAKLKASIQSVAEKISSLNLDQLIKGVGEAVASANKALKNANKLVGDIDKDVPTIMSNLNAAVDEGRLALTEARQRMEMKEGEIFYTGNAALQDARDLIGHLDKQVEPLLADARTAMQVAVTALDEAEVTLTAARKLVDDLDEQVEPLSTEVQTALQAATVALDEATGALRDARGLVNNLDDQVQPISSDAREALHTATAAFNEGKGAVEDARGLIANVDSQVEPISTQAQTALQTATATLEEGKTAMRDARGLITHVDAQVEPISTGAREAPYRVDWSRCVGKSWELDPVLLHRHQAGQPARPGDDLNTKTLGIELRRRF